MDKVMVIGASPNPTRFSYKAVRALIHNNYDVIPIGNRRGSIGDIEIITDCPISNDIRIVILYLNKESQSQYISYILKLNPSEILFNPGTENDELAQHALERGIIVRYDCALVLIDQDLL